MPWFLDRSAIRKGSWWWRRGLKSTKGCGESHVKRRMSVCASRLYMIKSTPKRTSPSMILSKTLAREVVIVHGEEISCGGLVAGSGSVRYVLSCSGSPLSWQWDQALAALTRLTSCVWTSIVRNEQSSAANGGVHRFTASFLAPNRTGTLESGSTYDWSSSKSTCIAQFLLKSAGRKLYIIRAVTIVSTFIPHPSVLILHWEISNTKSYEFSLLDFNKRHHRWTLSTRVLSANEERLMSMPRCRRKSSTKLRISISLKEVMYCSQKHFLFIFQWGGFGELCKEFRKVDMP